MTKRVLTFVVHIKFSLYSLQLPCLMQHKPIFPACEFHNQFNGYKKYVTEPQK